MTKIRRDRQVEIAQREIAKFAKLIEFPELMSISIHIHEVDDPMMDAPAFTTPSLISIRRDIIEEEPKSICVYLAHELGHHVFHNAELTSQYPPLIVNYGEDYAINWHIKEWWGFDVGKVKVKGLYSKTWGPKPVNVICEEITQKLEKKHKKPITRGCWCRGVSHPIILQAALHIRKKYNVGTAPKPLIVTDKVDDQRFMRQYPSLRRAVLTPDLPIDLFEFLKAMWLSSYMDKVTPDNVQRGVLPMSQAIYHNWTFEPKPNDQYATLAAALYTITLQQAREYVRMRYYNARHRLDQLVWKKDGLKYKIKDRWKRGKSVTHLWKLLHNVDHRIKKARIQADRLFALMQLRVNYLDHLYKENPPILKGESYVPVVSLRQKFKKKRGYYSIQRTEFVKHITWLCALANKKLKIIHSVEDLFKQYLRSMLKDETPEEEEEEGEESTTSGTGNGEGESNEEQPDDLQTPTSNRNGRGKKESPGAREQHRIKTLSTLSTKQLRSLERIMMHVSLFDTTLSSKPSREIDEDSLDAVTVATLGNNLQRLEPSELALLGLEATRMAFYSKLANHNLVVRMPTKTKRNSVALCIDCSGSMHSDPYEIACGFAVSMVKKLHKDGRGAAIIIFHDEIEYEIVISERASLDLITILQALLSAKSGGTDFDEPLLRCFQIKKQQRWVSMSVVMVTDGLALLGEQATNKVLEDKKENDRIALVLIGRANVMGFNKIEDEAYNLKRNADSMVMELTALGNTLL